MTIRQIILNGKGSAGSGNAWKVERDDSDPFVGQEFTLYHYSTRMLKWRESRRYGSEILYADIGHGSVSDQGGMNTAFRALGLPYRFDRDQRGGGARITDITKQLRKYGISA
jgi:hypothetical protein